MNKNQLSIYIDLSLWIYSRTNTGIQRVLKEFVEYTLYNNDPDIDYYYLNFNIESKRMHLVSASEIEAFIYNIQSYDITLDNECNLLEARHPGISVFFDIDAVWNSLLKRMYLYPQLKKNNYYIFNYLYDLSPIIIPQYTDENTCRNYVTFLSAIYSYSDMVFFDSSSAETEFSSIKQKIELNREIPTRVTGLGADYTKQTQSITSPTPYQQLFESKYLLFVGTIEPRKNHQIVLEAFTTLTKKYLDLNLIFIGKSGWDVAHLINRIETSPIRNEKLYWFDDIDDKTLSLFYKNAWIVIYLSKYEGYGLPIAESLLHGNITIASKNTSMYEVGRDFADYIIYNSHNEIVELVSLYYENTQLYQLKKKYIKEHFHFLGWGKVCQSIVDVLRRFPTTIQLAQQHLEELQFVIISINISTLCDTITAIDKYIGFVKEYIIITSEEYLSAVRRLSSKHRITIINETDILGTYTRHFNTCDHQKKNWLLRACLINIEHLESEFIMLDDDNRPIKPIDIRYFISADGRYNAYYFHDLLNWNQYSTSYDKGQINLKTALLDKCYEGLSYSAHAPQIINKEIYREAMAAFFEFGLINSIDEWSVYFNYAISLYPYLFHKKVYETLNWPANPADWQYQYIPREYSFENYYASVYAENESKLNANQYFIKNYSFRKKLQIKQQQYLPYQLTKDLFDQYQQLLACRNKIYGSLCFQSQTTYCYLFCVPQHIISIRDSIFRLVMNVKVINNSGDAQHLQIYYLLNGNPAHHIEWVINADLYSERVIELPISTYGMRRTISKIQLDLKINHKAVYGQQSPYILKLTKCNKTSGGKKPLLYMIHIQIEKIKIYLLSCFK